MTKKHKAHIENALKVLALLGLPPAQQNERSALCLLAILSSLTVKAQSEVEMADGMRSEGKIYVVVAIILIVLSGLIVYLVMLDRKVGKLEDLVRNKNK